jgi:Family of unknown function (DUF6056)
VKWGQAALVMALVGLGLPIVALGVQGWFARYAADDYCTASQVVTAGLVTAQSILYVSWSGRFAATLLITLAEVFGPIAVRVLPMLSLVVWLSLAAWSARQLSRATGYTASWLAISLAAMVVVYATLQTTADLPQALYWQTGLLTYVAPLPMLTFLVGWIARLSECARAGLRLRIGVCCLVAFAAGGTDETYAAAQVTMFGCGIVLAVLFASGRVRRRLVFAMLASLVGALLALAVVAAAPGNAVRAQTTIVLPIGEVVLRAVDFTRGWLRLTFARPHVIELVLLVGISCALGGSSFRGTSPAPPPRWGLIFLIIIAMGLVLLACMVPVYYALDADPPGRALLVPQYLLMCILAVGGWYAGGHLIRFVSLTSEATRAGAALGLVVLLALGPVLMTTRIVAQFGSDRTYAIEWDLLDTQIRADRARGVQDLTVMRLDPTGTVHNLDFFGSDRHDWLNECVARYYAVNSIASTS